MIGEAEGWFSHAFCEPNNDDDHIHFAMIFRAVKKEVRLDPFTCTFKKKLQKEALMPKFYTCFVNYTRKTSNDLDYC